MIQKHQQRGGGYGSLGSFGQRGQRPSGQAGSASGGHSGGHSGGQPPQGDEDPKTILKGTDTVSYRDTEKHLRPALLDMVAQEAAKDLGQIPTTQLRRFFEQVVAIKRRLELDPNIPDGEILAQVAFLKAAAAYAAGRDKNNAPVLKFLVKHANSIKAKQDFLDFHRHFETVAAFHRVYAEEKKGN